MENHTAAVIIIGNEILSGRTLDTNTQAIAISLANIGVILRETRTIPDHKTTIINTVRELSSKYNYVLTTGGIGPTHDDITSESIAAAFDVPYSRNEEIYNILKETYKKNGEELNKAREKMAYVPEGCSLIQNNATFIPGFVYKNVFAMAGIPVIMNSMLDSIIPMLKKGRAIKSESITIMTGESKIAAELEEVQNKYNDVEIGSYPFTENDQYGTTLVLRSQNYESLEKAYKELEIIVRKFSTAL